MKKKNNHYEIVIIGCGLTGMLMALTLASKGMEACIIEKNNLSNMNLKSKDLRTTAISQGTKRKLEKLEIWHLLVDFTEPIKKIIVEENIANAELEFDSSDLNEGSLGYIIDNNVLKSILLQQIIKNNKLKLIPNSEVKNVKIDKLNSNKEALIEINNKKITSNLIIVADGRYSKVRNIVNLKYYNHDYMQRAYVFNIKHQENHNGIALERFFPEGPLAILPMKKTKDNFYRSSVVWSIDKNLGDFSKLTKNEFKFEFMKRYDDYFGKIKEISEPKGYDLNVKYAYSSYMNRLVLVGDASQAIHPIAGQGFNLGVRDCVALGEVLFEDKSLGAKLGDEKLLFEYENKRILDRKAFIEATHWLNFLFSNNQSSVKNFRSFGLYFIQNSKFLKKRLMIAAMGIKDIKLPFLFRSNIPS